MKLNKKTVPAVLALLAVLAFAFWYGGDAPGLRGWTAGQVPAPSPAVSAEVRPSPAPEASAAPTAPVPPAQTPPPAETPAPTETPVYTELPKPSAAPAPAEKPASRPAGPEEAPADGPSPDVTQGDGVSPAFQGMPLDPDAGKDGYLTGPVPEGKPLPVEPQDAAISDTAYTCTLSVRCDTLNDNLDGLDPEKAELVPEDGVIFPAVEVTFYEGESVFNLLQREMKKNRIHMEFVNTPIYNSAYIEGISNLYEFDCGELSGWMYRVNGWFPNYGCSRYQLRQGDVVEWVYTCDLGADVGRSQSAGES